MTNYKLRGNDLYTSSGHHIASLKGSYIYDEHGHKVATLRGTDVYDEHGHKIATINDIKKEIDGAMGGISIVAFWLFFVR